MKYSRLLEINKSSKMETNRTVLFYYGISE